MSVTVARKTLDVKAKKVRHRQRLGLTGLDRRTAVLLAKMTSSEPERAVRHLRPHAALALIAILGIVPG